MYNIEFSSRARRDLRVLAERAPRHNIQRLYAAIDGLAREPRPHGVQQLRGRGKVYRIRESDYRIFYEIDDKERVVLISRVLRRNEGTYRF